MKKFYYVALNKNNETIENSITAESLTSAVKKLERKGYTILDIKEEKQISDYVEYKFYKQAKSAEFSIQEKKEFFNSFYHLYSSGVSVVETFKLIISSSNNKNIKGFCKLVVKKAEKGHSLRESLRNNSSFLGQAYTMLIVAGEESGKLAEITEGILKNIKKQEEIKSNIISSISYPVCVFSLALAVGMLFWFFILKVFASFADGGMCMSAVLKLLVFAIIKIIIVFAILISTVIYLCKNRAAASKVRSFFAGFGPIANLIKNFYFSNYFYVMALSYEAGVPLTEAISLSNSVINVTSYANQLKNAERMVQKGCKITPALASTNLFSNFAVSQIAAGEEAGKLDSMFKNIAFDYENKLDTAIKVMLKLVEPAMMIIIGAFVALIVVKGYNAYYKALLSMF